MTAIADEHQSDHCFSPSGLPAEPDTVASPLGFGNVMRCDVPRPAPRPRPATRPIARTRPVTSVAIAFSAGGGPIVCYHATSEERQWNGAVAADTVDAAVLDVVAAIRSDDPDTPNLRFLVSLPATSPLWQHASKITALFPGVTVEMPGLADRPLMKAARAAVVDPPTTTAHTPAISTVDGSPVWVATDGSVRRKVTGWGWLASTGAYGLMGFAHSRKQVGPKVVLISELRAIGDAVRKLRGRDITLLSDSKEAVAMVRRWMDGDALLPPGYTTDRPDGRPAGLVVARRLVHAERERLTPVWAKGHRGEPLNEGADALARLASRYAAKTSGLARAEYQRRAAELAKAFAREFNRRSAA